MVNNGRLSLNWPIQFSRSNIDMMGRDNRGLGVFGVKTLRRTIEVLIFILPTLSLSIFPNGDK